MSVILKGKRGPVVGGRVPQDLYDSVQKLVDGVEFKSMNDVVEQAHWHFVNEKRLVGIEGGKSLGN